MPVLEATQKQQVAGIFMAARTRSDDRCGCTLEKIASKARQWVPGAGPGTAGTSRRWLHEPNAANRGGLYPRDGAGPLVLASSLRPEGDGGVPRRGGCTRCRQQFGAGREGVSRIPRTGGYSLPTRACAAGSRGGLAEDARPICPPSGAQAHPAFARLSKRAHAHRQGGRS